MQATADDRDNDNKDSDMFYDAVALTYEQVLQSVNTSTVTAPGYRLTTNTYGHCVTRRSKSQASENEQGVKLIPSKENLWESNSSISFASRTAENILQK